MRLAWIRERNRNRARLWREHNPGAAAANTARYKERHPEYVANNAINRRKHHIVIATPSWANLHEIRKYYKEAKSLSICTGIQHHVDHIIPLRGHYVCGLHVEYNLRVVTAAENQHKLNSFLE